MLFRYPAGAAKDNWLHDCLAIVMQNIQERLAGGLPLPPWPEIIPELYRDELSTRRGLRDRIRSFYQAVSALDQADRDRIYEAFLNQNQIPQLLACGGECEDVEALPEPAREPIRNLFRFGFQLLGEFGVRDKVYSEIYSAIPDHLCPFCGLEYFDAPGGPREALDHYLSEARYPFAAANLRNLVPMGHKCNSKYKLAQDILRREDGTRRRSFDPYEATAGVRVYLSRSTPFEGKGGILPDWIIDFAPDNEEASTWDQVFRIRERYRRDILDIEFNRWLGNFSSWCRRTVQASAANAIPVLEALEWYADLQDECGLGDRAFLKAAMFRMLGQQCRDGNERLINLLQDLI